MKQATDNLTGRKLSSHIKAQIAQCRKDRKLNDVVFWQDMDFMHKRPSMKQWTLEQLKEQWHKTNKDHNITFETL